jgi:hypothetical protein
MRSELLVFFVLGFSFCFGSDRKKMHFTPPSALTVKAISSNVTVRDQTPCTRTSELRFSFVLPMLFWFFVWISVPPEQVYVFFLPERSPSLSSTNRTNTESNLLRTNAERYAS